MVKLRATEKHAKGYDYILAFDYGIYNVALTFQVGFPQLQVGFLETIGPANSFLLSSVSPDFSNSQIWSKFISKGMPGCPIKPTYLDWGHLRSSEKHWNTNSVPPSETSWSCCASQTIAPAISYDLHKPQCGFPLSSEQSQHSKGLASSNFDRVIPKST